MGFRASVVFLAVLLTPIVSLSQDRGTEPGATPDQTVELIKEWVLSLSLLGEARDQTTPPVQSRDVMTALMSEMTANRLAQKKVQESLLRFPTTAAFPADSVAASAVSAHRAIVGRLSDLFDQAFKLQQILVTLNSQTELAKTMAAVAQYQADMDQAWKMLPQVALLLSYTLVDMKRVTNGTLQHFRITAKQREELLTATHDSFPTVPATLKAGSHAVETSIALLNKVISDDHKSADQP